MQQDKNTETCVEHIQIAIGNKLDLLFWNLQVEELKTKEGVNLITFGIGSHTDQELLKHWASRPQNSKLYYTASFDNPAPEDLLDKIVKEFCAGTQNLIFQNN